jgi:hypothetical protein
MKLYLVCVGYYDVHVFFANNKQDLIELVKASDKASRILDAEDELSINTQVYEVEIKRGAPSEKRIH